MSQLKVYKASAGSGKTFRLAIEYMKLALSNETNYRHILAVTFTNKATAEMKSRIIGEMYRLANGKESAYLKVLAGEMGWSPVQVQHQAGVALKNILHDYSRFSVSTIDSFFQRVIKSFNRELGINTAYNVELDETSVLEAAADRLIQSIDDDEELLEWLNAFATDKMREGRGWKLKSDIIRLGSELFNEKFKSYNEEVYEKLNDRNFLRNYRKKLGAVISHYERRVKEIGQEGVNILLNEGLTVDRFKRKSTGPASAFQNLKDLKTDLSKTIVNAAEDSSAWVTATVKEPEKSMLLGVVIEKLMPCLQRAIDFIAEEERNYISAKLIVSQLYTLGILIDLRKFVKELCHEKGIVLISDSGHLLKDIISDSETPFVYERTGTNYSHFMIDEFQDTSGLQWDNFRPLIANSLSEDHLGMVVGDVKQAIYRWRSGDWRLLAGKLEESFPAFGLKNEVLNSNWRSLGRIIRFNNAVFELVPKIVQKQIDDELAGAQIDENPVGYSVTDVYSDSVQHISNSENAESGYVRIKFLSRKEDKESKNTEIILAELLDSVKKLQDHGTRANEIAILVRDRKEAKMISDLFLQQKTLVGNLYYNFDVLSGESLFISNSDAVRLIVSVLENYLDPDNQIINAEIGYLYYNKICPGLIAAGKKPKFADSKDTFPDSVLFEEIKGDQNVLINYISGDLFKESLSGKPVIEIIYDICSQFNLFDLPYELAYLQAFIDQVSIFERNHSPELNSFLDWWDEDGKSVTIPVADNFDAINVLTIHKSKGLEFTHVFVPFFDWPVQPQSGFDKAPVLWCKPQAGPFNEMELVPVKYKKEVGRSIFYREYFEEKFNSYIDNLNLMYVACTRAKASLYIWGTFSQNLATAGDLLKTAIENQAKWISAGSANKESIDFSPYYDQENMIFEFGQSNAFVEPQSSVQPGNNVRIKDIEFLDFRKILNIRKSAGDFFSSEWKNGINKGKIIHEILARVETKDDLPGVVKTVKSEGKIDSAQEVQVFNEITTLVTDPEVAAWFDGTYKIINERNILTGINGLKRPDRIMAGKNRTIVVDYKSGDFESENYKNQVRLYISELKRCGFENISGYIWYTKTNKRVQV